MIDVEALARLPYETWSVHKPVVSSDVGVVASQNVEAAAVGAAVLADGGNAMDAAIATALALTVAEPWMSGLGGGGYMTVYDPKENRVQVVDYGMKAAAGLNPADYPLVDDGGVDDWGWPAVVDDRNATGPMSIAVPGSAAGYGLALKTFGTRSWSEMLTPAIALAERGHRVTWWTTLMVAGDVPALAADPGASGTWVPNGAPPVMSAEPKPAFVPMGALAETLRYLAEHGPESFYHGPLAEKIAGEIAHLGGSVRASDLEAYEAQIVAPLSIARGPVTYHVPAGLTAGPSFADALARLPLPGSPEPDGAMYHGYAESVRSAYGLRFRTMGHAGDHGDRSCTTHLSVMDGDGMIVSLTSTLLARFGARVRLAETGLHMNNGIAWFDPRPGRPNSIAAGARPLSNMCPLVATRDGEGWFGLGASGGRKIMPAVYQIASFLTDYGMTLSDALHHSRIEPSELDRILVDPRLPADVRSHLDTLAPTVAWASMAAPVSYAVPTAVMRVGGTAYGAGLPYAPLVAAVGA